jgi:hypothetical protein
MPLPKKETVKQVMPLPEKGNRKKGLALSQKKETVKQGLPFPNKGNRNSRLALS